MRCTRVRIAALAIGLLLPAVAASQAEPDAFVREPDAREQAVVRAELGPRFRVLETDHYRVFSDTSPRYHRVVSGVLEQFHQLVRPRFFERDVDPLPFYLIEGGADFERFVTQRGLPEASAYGFYDRESRALYARRFFPDGRESGVGTLFHEATHAMIDAEFGLDGAPIWFHEGFASLFEVGRVLRGAWVYGNPNPWRESDFREAFEAGKVPALAAYLGAPEAMFRGAQAQRNIYYNTGRSLFLYVLLNHGEAQLRRFIRELRTGVSPPLALEHATGLALDRVEAQWHRSIREVNFGGDYLNRGVGPRALETLELGANAHPGYGNLRLNLAIAWLERGDREKAIENARAALADPRCIQPQLALSVLAHAIITTNASEAAGALTESLRYQPWNENVMKREFEMLAWMYEKIGDPARAGELRSELARLEALDRSARQ